MWTHKLTYKSHMHWHVNLWGWIYFIILALIICVTSIPTTDGSVVVLSSMSFISVLHLNSPCIPSNDSYAQRTEISTRHKIKIYLMVLTTATPESSSDGRYSRTIRENSSAKPYIARVNSRGVSLSCGHECALFKRPWAGALESISGSSDWFGWCFERAPIWAAQRSGHCPRRKAAKSPPTWGVSPISFFRQCGRGPYPELVRAGYPQISYPQQIINVSIGYLSAAIGT